MNHDKTDNDILKIFNELFATTFSTLDIDRKNFPEWDSMKHAELIILIQKKLNMRFNSRDIVEIENARQLSDAVKKSCSTL